MARSAVFTCNASASASEYTATVAIPMRRAVRTMRQAISPRLAISSVRNMHRPCGWSCFEIHHKGTNKTGICLLRPNLCASAVNLPCLLASHPEHPELRAWYRRIQCSRQCKSQHTPCIRGIDNAVIPQAGSRIIWMALPFILRTDRRLERFLLVHALRLTATHLRQDSRGLLAPHHRYPRIRPHEQKPRFVRSAAHAIVARAITAADDHRQLRHGRGGNRGHQLRTVLRNAARFIFPSHHEPRDVLQEHQRNASLAAQLDKMRTLQCRFGKQDAVVGQDADRITEDMRKAANQRRAVQALELIEI